MDWVAIGYWDTAGAELMKLAIDRQVVLGFGKGERGLLLVRQGEPEKISLDSVE